MTDIRWAMWLAVPHVELWQAVLLSLGIQPSDDVKRTATSDRVTLREANRFLRSRGREPHLKLPSAYWDRLSLCQVGLSEDGPIRPQGPKYTGALRDSTARVLLGEVSNFLTLSGFTLPEEMRALQLAAVPTAPAEPAPDVLTAVVVAQPKEIKSKAALKIEREDERLAFCEAEGIVFDDFLRARLPNGVGAAAIKLNIKRQTLSTDLKAALNRRYERSRAGKP